MSRMTTPARSISRLLTSTRVAAQHQLRSMRIGKCTPPRFTGRTTFAALTPLRPLNQNTATSALALSSLALFGGAAAAAAEETQERKRISFSTKATAETALAAKYDTYGGVLVDPASVIESNDVASFAARLHSSVAAWRADERKGVWLNIPTDKIAFLETAVEAGFKLHHCEEDHVMLTLWIPAEKGVENTLPGYTTHTVGVGAVVVNAKNEILVVQERSGPAAGIDFWKYPTGMVDPGEDAAAAAVREVKEETGIDAEVVALIAFREAHMPKNSTWQSGKTNIFMTYLLRPKTETINHCEREIAACKWLPLDDYWANSEKRMKPGTLYHAMAALATDAAALETNDGAVIPGFIHRDFELGFRKGSNSLYFSAHAAGSANDDRSRVGAAANKKQTSPVPVVEQELE